MIVRKILFLAPENSSDAFTSTGVLQAIIAHQPDALVELVTREAFVPFYQHAPARLRFHLLGDNDRPSPLSARLLMRWSTRFSACLSLMRVAMGRRWHRVVSFRTGRVGGLPNLLWARHRHIFHHYEEHYNLPDPYQPENRLHPAIWTDERPYLPLPEILTAQTRLLVFAPNEATLSGWDAKLYAELAWRLVDSDSALHGAHVVIMSDQQCPIAQAIADNIPAGQRTMLRDLPYSKCVALMRRACLLVGTDRLAACMAPCAGTGLVVRLATYARTLKGRPYAIYSGTQADELAHYLVTETVKRGTHARNSANQTQAH